MGYGEHSCLHQVGMPNDVMGTPVMSSVGKHISILNTNREFM